MLECGRLKCFPDLLGSSNLGEGWDLLSLQKKEISTWPGQGQESQESIMCWAVSSLLPSQSYLGDQFLLGSVRKLSEPISSFSDIQYQS